MFEQLQSSHFRTKKGRGYYHDDRKRHFCLIKIAVVASDKHKSDFTSLCYYELIVSLVYTCSVRMSCNTYHVSKTKRNLVAT